MPSVCGGWLRVQAVFQKTEREADAPTSPCTVCGGTAAAAPCRPARRRADGRVVQVARDQRASSARRVAGCVTDRPRCPSRSRRRCPRCRPPAVASAARPGRRDDVDRCPIVRQSTAWESRRRASCPGRDARALSVEPAARRRPASARSAGPKWEISTSRGQASRPSSRCVSAGGPAGTVGPQKRRNSCRRDVGLGIPERIEHADQRRALARESRAGRAAGSRRSPASAAPTRSPPCSRASAACRRPSGSRAPGRPCGWLSRKSRKISKFFGFSTPVYLLDLVEVRVDAPLADLVATRRVRR